MRTTFGIGSFAACVFIFAGGANCADEKPDGAKPLKVAIVVFPGVELLDFAGPGEVFSACTDADGKRLFDVYTVGLSKKPLESMRFLSITPKYDATDAPAPDIVVIPGGTVNQVMDDAPMMKWIEQCADAKCLIFSVCNGASVLARAGMLDGLKVTTHHGNVEILGLLAPKTICLRDRRFVDNGRVVTAAGVSAGIDASLYLIAKLKGIDTAYRSATHAEYDHWAGFASRDNALPKPDRDGVVSQPGRVHKPERQWAVMALLKTIKDEGVEAALKQYPKLLEGTRGHDREMIEEKGFDETAWWLVKNSRDKDLGISALKFIAAAYPKSSNAQYRLGLAYLEHGKKDDARQALERALALDAANKAARDALRLCQ